MNATQGTTSQDSEVEHYACRRARERAEQARRRLGDAVVNRPAGPALTAEGWFIIDSEYREDDPWANDDCWHRGPYWVYSVRGTSVRVEERSSDGIGQTWRRLEETLRAAGLDGFAELVGDAAKGLGYRRIVTIDSDADLAESKRRGDEAAAKYAAESDLYYVD
jgi:hypothetical protein